MRLPLGAPTRHAAYNIGHGTSDNCYDGLDNCEDYPNRICYC